MSYQFKFSEHSNVGKVRSVNEDALANVKTKNGHLFVICDGMGGAVGGKTAATLATKSIIVFLDKVVYPNKSEAIRQAIRFANEQIIIATDKNPTLKGMGTTTCVLLIHEAKIYYGHVGDSRIYLKTKNRLYTLTKDHSFVNQLIDNQDISIEQAFNHPNKNRILQALGIKKVINPTIANFSPELLKGDELLLCSDGLNDMLPDEEILLTMIGEEETENNLDSSLSKLIEKAIAYGGKDNVSAQIIRITESPYSERKFEDRSLLKTEIIDEKTISKAKWHKKKIIILSSLLGLLLAVIGFFILIKIDFKALFDKLTPIWEKTKEQKKEENNNTKKIDSLKQKTPIEKKQQTLNIETLRKQKTVVGKYPTIRACGEYYNTIKSSSSPGDDDVLEIKNLALKSALAQTKHAKTEKVLLNIQNTYILYFKENKELKREVDKKKIQLKNTPQKKKKVKIIKSKTEKANKIKTTPK